MSAKNRSVLKVIVTVACLVLLFLGYLILFAARWYIATYGDMGFDSVLFTLFSGLNGVQGGLVKSYLLKGLLPTVLSWGLTSFIIFFESPKKIVVTLFNRFKVRLYPLRRRLAVALSVVLSLALVLTGAIKMRMVSYIINQFRQSTVIESYYIDPQTTEIIFPDQKQNLIYIFVESLETTFYDKSQGGALNYNVIPELYELAENNVNFSNNDDVGGFKSIYGTNWTAGAMVSQTSGIPLKVPSGMADNTYGDNAFLPGAYSLMNILKENGYYQSLMVGSDCRFANRDQYYNDHGVDKIYDYYTAQADGIIADDYYAWWGMEDKYLYRYAKQELLKISEMDQPFAFSMLTVDTHHIDGYKCEYCLDTYDEQYENVLSCASRQLASFVEWISEQDFFENTTVIICGDHVTMDEGYIVRNTAAGYERHVYNCIINSRAEAKNTKNRQFSAMDMFPTTLAAIGCTVTGERLGLGTNMFSDMPTLLEELGASYFNSEMEKASDFYVKNFMLN